jgi:VanZ family protein
MKLIRHNAKVISMIRIVLILMLAGWMLLIYLKSNEPYQAQNIRPFLADWIPLSFVDRWLPHMEFYYSGALFTWKEPYILIEFIIRKSAHVAEYAILTLLWISTLYLTLFKKYRLIISAVMVVIYAASDEWHQSFIASRTGHAIDVAVDSLGMLCVMLLLLGFDWRNRKKGAVTREHNTNFTRSHDF